MPAKNEACTAVITEIRDNDAAAFSASVYDQENQLMEEIPVLDYKTMDRLNSDENVFRISVQGNIPFLDAKSMALVLVDMASPWSSTRFLHKKFFAMRNIRMEFRWEISITSDRMRISPQHSMSTA